MGGRAMVAVVTGASSGIGLETALLLAGSGYTVHGCSRSPGRLEEEAAKRGRAGVKAVEADVDSTASVDGAVGSVLGAEGRIDALVNCAGYAQIGAIEDMTIGEVKRNMETNFFGTVRMTRAVVPAMRAQGGGRIVNVSAVAGRMGFALGSAYVASKFAVEGLTESLRHELRQFGIRVTAVEPGVVRTGFHGNMMEAKAPKESPYADMAKKLVGSSSQLYRNGTDPQEVARVILGVLGEDEPPLRRAAGKDAEGLLEEKARRTDEQFEEYVQDIFADIMRLDG